jgi:hypothetical protein
MMTELLDFAEQTVHVAGIFAQQAAFEHQGVFGSGQVTDFTPTANPLVGIDANDTKVPVIPAHRGNPHIGNLEVARVRRALDVIFGARSAHLLFAFFQAT